MGESDPVLEDVSESEASAAEKRQVTNQADVKSIINSIDIEGESVLYILEVIKISALKRAKLQKALELQKKADEQPSLTPQVKWAQNPEALSLTVCLSQIFKPEIKINGNTLEFLCSGVGAAGERRNYEFELEFFDHVDRKMLSLYHIIYNIIYLLIIMDHLTHFSSDFLLKQHKEAFTAVSLPLMFN